MYSHEQETTIHNYAKSEATMSIMVECIHYT